MSYYAIKSVINFPKPKTKSPSFDYLNEDKYLDKSKVKNVLLSYINEYDDYCKACDELDINADIEVNKK